MFKPKQIGLADTQKEKLINEVYSEICTLSTSLFWQLEFFFNCPDEMLLTVFLDFLKCEDPKKFLYSKFIELNKIEFPGINRDKIIELGLVDVPLVKFNEAIKDRIQLINEIQKTKELNFFFPLAKLWNEENRGFAITFQDVAVRSPEFDELLFKHVREFTSNEKENEAIEIFENTIKALNDCMNVGIIPRHPLQWKNGGMTNLIQSLIFDETAEKPLSMKPMVKRLRCYEHIFSKQTNQSPYKNEDLFLFVLV